ncbi:uncharacterized protein MONOS_13939 [Monocercomonoides exilis]|uniref:uncharacterized protein n=1 Tax=Monocercomonoides exilis TaxID=2049356 RepID=UPI003559ED88|nr:hypothetical protein MONOS_13939 [Monocercomonoides exilis]|eukprot:MONOS_13939.1-p1 / transcript=MONOS_13939.1 / gene=MONOS_13939 / organism=Monocercomonoides_exilis_PA203 / gene_product=unspecified product / transcript_product=unspecified product / location=Mono_scaffold00907:9983-10430(+) / protein_length=96 / sequence_SO=supercontig / SO=protein_coding / is_pseudo=false
MDDVERDLRTVMLVAAVVHELYLSLSLLLWEDILVRIVRLYECRPDEEGSCYADVKQVVRKVRGTDGGAERGEEGAGAVDPRAEIAARGGKEEDG